ncbi:hypothetical protein Slin15195_G076080 [Septoria linicola]|uniref:Uncharacterized protein n=1 Tax=Septoria linicola TaxID=215465 RepID=A0A9Q9ARW8_9PEZI|nr:hypothetical protein Slin15195_G076080 [Septoria linicola]
MSATPATFFSLARELRDLIYYQLLHSVENRPITHNIHVTATNIPLAHLLLINKQFSREYQSASSELSTLTIHNHDPSSSSEGLPHYEEQDLYISPGTTSTSSSLSYTLTLATPPPKLPSSITSIPHLTFDLIASRFRAAGDELAVLELWTDGLLRQFELKRIKSVSIDVVVSLRAFSVVDFESALLWSGNWTSLTRLKRLGVWKEGNRGRGGRGDFGFGNRNVHGEQLGAGVGGKKRIRTLMLEWERERCRFGTRVERAELLDRMGNFWLNTAEHTGW